MSELLARIIANPDDDALRDVYADALVQAGDPQRGRALARLGIATLDDLVFSPLHGDELARAAALWKLEMRARIYVIARTAPPARLLGDVIRADGLDIKDEAPNSVTLRDFKLGNTLVHVTLETDPEERAQLRGIARVLGDPALASANGLVRIAIAWDTNRARIAALARRFATAMSGIAYDTETRRVL